MPWYCISPTTPTFQPRGRVGSRRGTLALDTDVPGDVDELAPYPLLVAIGTSENHHLRLLNLEHLGIVTVTGDSEKAEAFGRYVAAELALNPWSALVDVDTLGLAKELTTSLPCVSTTTPTENFNSSTTSRSNWTRPRGISVTILSSSTPYCPRTEPQTRPFARLSPSSPATPAGPAPRSSRSTAPPSLATSSLN